MAPSIFKAYDVRATYPNPLNEAAAWRVGYATAQFLQAQAGKGTASGRGGLVLVSRDMRPSSPALCAALADGLRAAGADVIDLGMCDTSFMYFAVNHLKAIGGVQTTASHNPVHYNGFKISGALAVPIGAESGLKTIEADADEHKAPKPGSVAPKGSYRTMDLWADYRKHVLGFLRPLKKPVKVFIDASNGMAGTMVPKVFGGVPNLEIVPLNFEVGATFAHEPNPLVAANMKPTQEGVRRTGAAMGACFDGDADRCILTDENGQIIGCDHLTALLCSHFLGRGPGGSPGAAVVYDLRSSKVVEEEIKRLGGQPRRSRVGHVFIKALLRETKGIFGGELSGHFYFRDNFYADSGAIAFAAVLSVLDEQSEPLSALIAPFKKYPQSGEINFEVPDKAGALAALRAKFAGKARIDELDGVTIDAWTEEAMERQSDGATKGSNLKPGACSLEPALRNGWWFNVRPSNTEPLLRLNAEARDQRTLDSLLTLITPVLGKRAEGH
jgi:phosphomannomutase